MMNSSGYTRYRVNGCKIKVYAYIREFATADLHGDKIVLSVTPSTNASIFYPDYEYLGGGGMHHVKMLELNRTSKPTGKVSNYMNLRRMTKRADYANPGDLRAAYDANPTFTWYWIITVDGSGCGNYPTYITWLMFDVHLTYYTQIWKFDNANI